VTARQRCLIALVAIMGLVLLPTSAYAWGIFVDGRLTSYPEEIKLRYDLVPGAKAVIERYKAGKYSCYLTGGCRKINYGWVTRTSATRWTVTTPNGKAVGHVAPSTTKASRYDIFRGEKLVGWAKLEKAKSGGIAIFNKNGQHVGHSNSILRSARGIGAAGGAALLADYVPIGQPLKSELLLP
jgi:hypothetical protein